jgi:uncharacterized protein YutE (UPF0331/DUF86 family)
LTDPALVARKLAMLTDHVGRLRERRPGDVETLRGALLLQDGIALSLLVAVQEAVDIALHVAAEAGWGIPSSYREAFELLARHGVIEQSLAASMANAAALRNRIAHGYATLDVDRLWHELPAGIATLESFASAIARYLAGADAQPAS